MTVTVFSPAKINLYLAVTGRRPDGFHDLVSVAAPLDFGDELKVELNGGRGMAGGFTLECDHPEVPVDGGNLVLKAARAFAAATGWPDRLPGGAPGGVHFQLTKRVPMGAGLGGGSSNAVAALQALNTLSGELLSGGELAVMAAKIGSDCAMFLHGMPVVMRGRGEQLTALPESAALRLRGQRVLLFKPGFGISTPWAYGGMAADAPRHYLPAPAAEQKLAAWMDTTAPLSRLLFNNMEGVAFEKYIALPVLLGKLSAQFGVGARMSGSGSACFALLDDAAGAFAPEVVTQMIKLIRECWGESVFVQEARLV